MRPGAFREYAAFLAVADAGGFAAGAKAFGVTASAMSQIIKRLEQRLGVQLFRRTTRSLSTTDEGERLLERLRVAFKEIQSATEDLDERRAKPAGLVRIIAPRLAYRDVLQPVMAQFCRQYPDVALDVQLEEGLADIVTRGVDIGIRLGEYVSPQTVAFPIGPSLRQIAVASPAYLHGRSLPRHPRDLADHLCINWRPQGAERPYLWEFAKDGEEITIEVRGALTLSDREMAAAAAKDGIGIALWVEHRLQPWIRSGELVPLLCDWSAPYRGFHAYYYRDRHLSLATRAFLEALRAFGKEGGARPPHPHG